jgi:hypothetical protein
MEIIYFETLSPSWLKHILPSVERFLEPLVHCPNLYTHVSSNVQWCLVLPFHQSADLLTKL